MMGVEDMDHATVSPPLDGKVLVTDKALGRWWNHAPAARERMEQMGITDADVGHEYFALVNKQMAIVCPVRGEAAFFMWLRDDEWRWVPLACRRPCLLPSKC